MYICVSFACIYYEGKWQGCHSERSSQVGRVGHQEPCEIQRGQTQSPGSGKEETLVGIQARAAWQRCVLSRSSVAQQQPQGLGAGAEGGPVLAMPSPMGNSPLEVVMGSTDRL